MTQEMASPQGSRDQGATVEAGFGGYSMSNPNDTKPPDQPSQECPVCGEVTDLVLHGLQWCRHCECGWLSPRQYAKGRGLRPHQARQEIVERLPWHHRGRPVVRVMGGRREHRLCV